MAISIYFLSNAKPQRIYFSRKKFQKVSDWLASNSIIYSHLQLFDWSLWTLLVVQKNHIFKSMKMYWCGTEPIPTSYQQRLSRCSLSSTPRAGRTHPRASRHPGADGSLSRPPRGPSGAEPSPHTDCRRAVGCSSPDLSCAGALNNTKHFHLHQMTQYGVVYYEWGMELSSFEEHANRPHTPEHTTN